MVSILPSDKHLRRILCVVYFAFALFSVWLIIRFALPWLLPFVLALITARITDPVIRLLMKKLHIDRGFASVISTFTFLAIIIGLLSLILGRIVYELTAFVKDLPTMLSGTSPILSNFEGKIYGYIIAAPVEMQEYLESIIKSITEKSTELPAMLSGKLLGILTTAISYAPKTILFTLTYAISVLFMSSRYPEVTSFLMRQIPERHRMKIKTLKSDLMGTLGKWLKAQLMLCGITWIELALAFTVLSIDYAILLALLVAVIDALPVFGTGTVLIPWAIVSLVSGNTSQAVALIVIYGIVTLVRNFLEPKLVGGQIGLHPVATLIAIYIGFCSCGIPGMVLFPILLITLKQFNERGYIKLWK